MFVSYVFLDKNQKILRMCRMQVTKQAVAILSLISGNVFRFVRWGDGARYGWSIAVIILNVVVIALFIVLTCSFNTSRFYITAPHHPY